jgi:branched-chain amino acid transport system ATP-binding protein
MFGSDVTRLPPYRRTRLGMGRTFQADRPFEELTVLENGLAV